MWVEWFLEVNEKDLPIETNSKYPYWKYNLQDSFLVRQYLPLGEPIKYYWPNPIRTTAALRRTEILFTGRTPEPKTFEKSTLYLRIFRNTKNETDDVEVIAVAISDEDFSEYKLFTKSAIRDYVFNYGVDNFDYDIFVISLEDFNKSLNVTPH